MKLELLNLDLKDGKGDVCIAASACDIQRLREFYLWALKVGDERDELVAALDIAEVGMCAVGVPHAGERKVLQDAVNVVRATLAKVGADRTGEV